MVNIIFASFFYLLVGILALMPFRLIYVLSDFIAFIIQYVFAYRKHTIISNLKLIYPDIRGQELKRLIRRIYRNLADILIEGIKAFSMSKEQVNQRHVILNPEILEPFYQAGRSVIIVTGHYGNWEWGAFSASLQTKFDIIGFYKPLKNKRIDGFARRSRAKYGTLLASIYETSKTFEDNKGRPVIYLMAADQSPSSREKSHWVEFLGRDTAFLHGPEKHARYNNHAVMYVAIRRIKRGFYGLHLSLITDNPSALPEGEITRRFAGKLESVILEDPADWLWSHKRWKLTR